MVKTLKEEFLLPDSADDLDSFNTRLYTIGDTLDMIYTSVANFYELPHQHAQHHQLPPGVPPPCALCPGARREAEGVRRPMCRRIRT